MVDGRRGVMAQAEGRYFASTASFETESERLQLVEAYGDPVTARQLEAVGVRLGWRCLEVGAGRGSVTRMLSERVGPSGSVVATDIDTRFLKELTASNIQVRQHNILSDPLDGPCDFVHSRYLLEHVPEPAKAIRNMVAALRPGGVLLAEATDALTFGPADDASPEVHALKRLITVLTEVVAAAGVLARPVLWPEASEVADGGRAGQRQRGGALRDLRGGSERAHLLRATVERLRGLLLVPAN
jgi:SAM-dependent methyltransferase